MQKKITLIWSLSIGKLNLNYRGKKQEIIKRFSISDASYSVPIIHAYEHSNKDLYFCDLHQTHSKMKLLDIKLVSVN